MFHKEFTFVYEKDPITKLRVAISIESHDFFSWFFLSLQSIYTNAEKVVVTPAPATPLLP